MKMHELLSGPERWTQGAYARDAEGRERGVFEESARCWCLVGALDRCYPEHDEDVAICVCLIEAIRSVKPENGHICSYNDAPERTFDEVHDLLIKLDV